MGDPIQYPFWVVRVPNQGIYCLDPPGGWVRRGALGSLIIRTGFGYIYIYIYIFIYLFIFLSCNQYKEPYLEVHGIS